MATAADLRALAARLDEVESREAASAAAKQAYQADPSDPDLKAAHRAASQALADARSEHRSLRAQTDGTVAVHAVAAAMRAGLEG